MAFELKKNEEVPKAIRRLVGSRVDKALACLKANKRVNSDIAVHEARKQFKQIRGTLRLVRNELGERTFSHENQAFRDAGRPLSAVRDAVVLVQALKGLLDHFRSDVSPGKFAPLMRAMKARCQEIRTRTLKRERALTKVSAALRAALARIESWPLEHQGWKALKGGLRKVYSQGRLAMRDACWKGTDDSFHEWRKRAKDLRYQLELLTPMWPDGLTPLAGQARELTDWLGEDHDLSVLREIVANEFEKVCPIQEQELLFGLIDQRRKRLRRDAMKLGRRLYEERDGDFIQRMRGYWKAWHQPDKL